MQILGEEYDELQICANLEKLPAIVVSPLTGEHGRHLCPFLMFFCGIVFLQTCAPNALLNLHLAHLSILKCAL